MKRVILLNYDHTFAIADTPDLVKDGLEIYKFLSSYDEVTVTVKNGPVLGTFVHIALSPDRAFVYDFKDLQCRGSFGPYTIRNA